MSSHHSQRSVTVAHHHGIQWSYHVFHHLETVAVTERWSSLFEDTATALISWQQHGGLGQGSPEGRACSESVSSIWYHFPHSRDLWAQELGVEKGIVPLHSTLSDPQGKYLIPVPMTLSSAGPEVWVAEAKSVHARSHNKYSIELEAQTSLCLLRASDALKPRLRKE